MQIELLHCGVNCVRINMSHATRAWAKDTVDTLREYLHSNPGKICALTVELAGPEARTGRELQSVSPFVLALHCIALRVAIDLRATVADLQHRTSQGSLSLPTTN